MSEVSKAIAVDDDRNMMDVPLAKNDNEEQNHEDTARDEIMEYSKLNVKSYLNVVAFVINIVVNYVIGVTGIAPYSVGGLSDIYQTIISPDSYAFSIWSLIFLSQGIFCIAQLLKRFRSLTIIQDGISWYFIIANICQASWIFAWCWNQITIALVLIMLVNISLNVLVINQASSSNKSASNYLEYWLFQFPFHIHCGWITAATSLNVNIQFIAAGVNDPSVQLAVGILTLAVLHAIALGWLYIANKPNYTIPLVLAWANAAIAVECSNPKETIVERFGETIINAVLYSASAVAIIIGCLCITRVALSFIQGRCCCKQEDNNVQETNSSETSSDEHEQV